MTAPGDDPYLYPNGVLRNLFGITDAEELTHIEATLTALRIAEIIEHPIAGHFDLDHLKALHHHIFQDVFEWAGELRRVDIFKNSSRFAHFAFLEQSAVALFARLAAEHHLQWLDVSQFASRAAFYLGELNALHPFREGNGRTQRMFLSLLAREAGYQLDWTQTTPERMTEASVQSLFRADNSLFEQMLLEISTPIPP